MKVGYVAVIGKTNAGKSTLINKLLNYKLNIVSSKKQTTRNNILGILTENDIQIIFIDTPGIHKSKNQLDRYMNKSVRSASEGADVIVYLIDGSKKIDDEELKNVINLYKKNNNLILVLNKIDMLTKESLYQILYEINKTKIKNVVPISSKKKINLNELKYMIIDFLPEKNSLIFDQDEITDKSIKFLCSEIVREKILNFTNQEIPHGVKCEVINYDENKKLVNISIDIICEKESHKSIIIGKNGISLKRIGSSARIEIEKLVNKKVMLNLFVKVEKDWRNKPIKEIFV